MLSTLSARNAVPIGVEDGKIPNAYITSSSTYNRYHAPWLGRLNNMARGRYKGGWSARKNDKRQWLQFNLGSPTLIKVIRTQGRQDASQWVTSYKVYYGNDGIRFTLYRKGGRLKVRLGNENSIGPYLSFKTQSKNVNCKTLLVIISIAVPALDLQMLGEGEGGGVGHPDPEILRGGLQDLSLV